MKNKKKISSLILAVLMIVSMMPFNTYAAGNEAGNQSNTTTEADQNKNDADKDKVDTENETGGSTIFG